MKAYLFIGAWFSHTLKAWLGLNDDLTKFRRRFQKHKLAVHSLLMGFLLVLLLEPVPSSDRLAILGGFDTDFDPAGAADFLDEDLAGVLPRGGFNLTSEPTSGGSLTH